jgi:hypothetical protein
MSVTATRIKSWRSCSTVVIERTSLLCLLLATTSLSSKKRRAQMFARTQRVNCNDTSSGKFLIEEEERSTSKGHLQRCHRGRNDSPEVTTEAVGGEVIVEISTKIEAISSKTNKVFPRNSINSKSPIIPRTNNLPETINNSKEEVEIQAVVEGEEDRGFKAAGIKLIINGDAVAAEVDGKRQKLITNFLENLFLLKKIKAFCS